MNSNLKFQEKNSFKDAISQLKEMSDIETLIKSKFESDALTLTAISSYLLELGGKRMRPALCILLAKAFGMDPISPQLIQIAAGIELIHMATLLHDDIIDKSDLRRHKESAFVKFGLNDTLLTGDFLLVRAFSLCAGLSPEIVAATEKSCVELTEGEILELPLNVKQASVEDSITIARKKTAALFSLAGFSAGTLCQLSTSQIENLRLFGQNIGIAFQVLDDILDVTSSVDLLGKPSGTDLRERKPSLINVLWVEAGSDLSKTLLKGPFESKQTEDQFVSQAIQELQESPTVEQARKIAGSYAEAARENLLAAAKGCSRQNTSYLDIIMAFVDYTLNRIY